MKKKITACILVLALLTALLAGCTETADPTDAETTERTPPSGSAVTAKNLEALGNEKSEVVMLILLSDGWILDISLGMVYPIEPGSIFGMAYEALSDTVFIWKPTEEELSEHWKLARCYEPKMREDERQTLLHGWHGAVECVKRLSRIE